jgi:hypothetical protein
MTIYLYVKKCSHCDLKYFGKTTQRYPRSYGGSGIYWKEHLKHHKAKQETIELWSFEEKEKASEFAIQYSEKNNITQSNDWANLKYENGLDGWPPGIKQTEESKLKQSKSRLGKYTKKCTDGLNIYSSLAEMAAAHGIKSSACSSRISSPRFPEFRYIGLDTLEPTG